MTCAHYREARSAWLDGEAAGIPDDLVEAHVASGAGCTAYAAGLARLPYGVRAAEPAPDLSASNMAQAPPSGGPAPSAGRTPSTASPFPRRA